MTTFTLGHVTDVHLGPVRGLTPRYWNLKRATGFVNWQRARVHAHRRDVADRLIADLKAQSPDHIAVTGDLTNLGLPAEHSGALDWLQTVGEPANVSVIPGNHDIYTSIGDDPGVERWRSYMPDDNPTETVALFPYVRRLGGVALVGLNSAIPTPPMIAAGSLGSAQRNRLAGVLERLAAEATFTVVMIHHPPLPGQAARSRGLRDADELERLLMAHGAGLVIHGHNHRNMLEWRMGPEAPFPVIGAPSLSLGVPHKHEPLARYNLYRIDTSQHRASLELVGRGLAEPGGPVVELERRVLVAPAMQPMPAA
jgi:3',5'-cyclic AMP phosphodiesterase CpdA